MDFAASLLGILQTVATFLVVITILVAVHELGHFWFARMFGMEVKAFAVMMGGIRKTDLRPLLRQPLEPAWMVWALAVLGLGLFMGGIAVKNMGLEAAGLGILALPLPAWIAWRIARLYHLSWDKWTKTMGISLAVGLLILMVGTRGAGMTPPLLLGVILASAFTGVLLLYYRPVIQKSEHTEMGEGRLDVEVGLTPDEQQKSGLGADLLRWESIPVSFRPLLWWRDRRGTEFSFLALPLGGFAAIKGMHPKEDGSEVAIEGGFYSKPPWQRFLVLFAGPLFSILFGILLLTGLYATVGAPGPMSTNVVRQVMPGSPADQAGIKKGDTVVEVAGKPVANFRDLAFGVRDRFVESSGTYRGLETPVVVSRGGERVSLTLTPRVGDRPSPVMNPDGSFSTETRRQATLGVMAEPSLERMGIGEAAVEASMAPVRMVQLLGSLLSRPDTARDAIGGPISMAEASQSASQSGWYSIVLMAASLSISLGIMNLLPVPPLDGGQMVVAFVEMLRRGRRLSIGLQQSLSTVGMFFVIGLTLLAFVVDLGRQAERNQPPKASGSAPR